MLVWRLTSPEFARNLDGEGSRAVGGRWNTPGERVVYACAHLSLSVLEVYVHLPPALRLRLPEMEAVRISMPDEADATEISRERFEQLMSRPDPFAACQAAGDEWLARGMHLALRAPSVIVPQETNLMLNVAHPRMRDVRIVSTERFRFDPRLSTIR